MPSTRTPAPGAAVTGPARAVSAWVKSASMWTAAPLLAVAFAVQVWAARLRDPDQFWHILMGRDILTHGRFTGDPTWVYGPGDTHWVTTQWLAEVVMAIGNAVLGWNAGIWAELTLGSGLLAWWAWLLLRRGPGLPARTGLYLLIALLTTGFVQERPALLGFYATTLLGISAARWVRTGWWPAWWQPLLLTFVWVQIHGSWILVPAMLTATTLMDVCLAHGTVNGWKTAGRRAVTIVATTSVAIVSPAGWDSVVAVARIGSAARGHLVEWFPTTITTVEGATLLAVAVLTAVAWARTRGRVPAREVALAAGMFLFAMIAVRNVYPAVLLTGIVLSERVATVWATPARQARVFDRVAVAVAAAVCVASTVAAVASTLTRDLFADGTNLEAITLLNQQPGERRVVVSWNDVGRVEATARPWVQVAIDGRADRYGPDIVDAYVGLINATGDWEATLAAYHPTDVIVGTDDRLHQALVDLGWRTLSDNGRLVYLVPPGTGPC